LKNSLNSWLIVISGSTRCRLAPTHHSGDFCRGPRRVAAGGGQQDDRADERQRQRPAHRAEGVVTDAITDKDLQSAQAQPVAPLV
jgi:hypothetical protein